MIIINAEPYRGGEIRTKDTFRYGRFEIRMKGDPGSGVVNSFFLYRDHWAKGLDGAKHCNKIDIELLGQYIKWIKYDFIHFVIFSTL